jgi:hypothetical protein
MVQNYMYSKESGDTRGRKKQHMASLVHDGDLNVCSPVRKATPKTTSINPQLLNSAKQRSDAPTFKPSAQVPTVSTASHNSVVHTNIHSDFGEIAIVI